MIEDFRRLELVRNGKRTVVKSRQDKGHREEIRRFVAAVRGNEEPPSSDAYLASTRATIALTESIRTGRSVKLD